MHESIRRLFAASLDYAGLFPPASLPLGEAWANYCRYAQSPDAAWLLRSFVCPAAKLGELAGLMLQAGKSEARHEEKRTDLEVHPTAKNMHLALIGSPLVQLAEAESSLRGDVAAAREFLDRISAADGDWTFFYEAALPPAALEHPSRLPQWCDCLNRATTEFRVSFEQTFWEVPWLIDPAAAAEDLASFLWRTNAVFGLKFRTGGTDAAAFPTSKQLSAAIFACQHNSLPWKATAGLHHALPRQDAASGAKHHGLLNVFVAAVLARKYQLTAIQLRDVLKDDAAEAFQFDDRRLRWREHSAKLPDIEATRKESLISFGSCSVDEPLEELDWSSGRLVGW